jgi:hypothetical protein
LSVQASEAESLVHQWVEESVEMSEAAALVEVSVEESVEESVEASAPPLHKLADSTLPEIQLCEH